MRSLLNSFPRVTQGIFIPILSKRVFDPNYYLARLPVFRPACPASHTHNYFAAVAANSQQVPSKPEQSLKRQKIVMPKVKGGHAHSLSAATTTTSRPAQTQTNQPTQPNQSTITKTLHLPVICLPRRLVCSPGLGALCNLTYGSFASCYG